MSDKIVDKIRNENYLLKIFKHTSRTAYINIARNIIEFIKEIYRHIEPSHFNGQIVVFYDFSDSIDFIPDKKEEFYDKGALNTHHGNIIFKIRNEDELPLYWYNCRDSDVTELLSTSENFIAYVFEDKKEKFIVNQKKIIIRNQFSCPSIFALQYHYLNEALSAYKNKRIKNVSCEHFKRCWYDEKRIYFKNKPEKTIQKSLKEFIISRVRGVKVNREFNLNASKPVDVRVYWREANRTALIELKWLGQSLKKDGSIGTLYSNCRANQGMKQIKEYIDLNSADNPVTIAKGYLIVIDARRKNVKSTKVSTISRENGFFYAGKELIIDENIQYWKSIPNIAKPIRMFVEPICE